MAGITRPIRPGHTGLVGLPLFLTMMFCFAFVLVQAHQLDSSQATSSDNISDQSTVNDQAEPHTQLSTRPASSHMTVEPTSKPVSDKTGNPAPPTASASDMQSGTTPLTRADSNVIKHLQSTAPASSRLTGSRITDTVNQVDSQLNGTVRHTEQELKDLSF